MYRKVKGEFGVNGVTTQTTQTHQSTQSKKSTLSDDDKKILELVHNYPSMSQREYANELGWNLDRVKYYLRKMKIYLNLSIKSPVLLTLVLRQLEMKSSMKSLQILNY